MLRPRLAPGFTVVPGDAQLVWLVAGEDVRIALRGDDLATWLPALLEACDGTRTIDALVAERPADARALLDGLVGERILVDGGAVRAHQALPPRWHVEGDGQLAEALRARAPGGGLAVFAQDTLDLGAALAANARMRAAPARWLWATIGPAARGFVGPLLLPDAGPCLECLIDHFRLRSPVPALYDQIVAHAGPFAPAAFEPAAVDAVASLVAWKLALIDRPLAPAALYALHVVEVATLETSSHRVLINPECPACATPGT